MEECKSSGVQFTDKEFPHEFKSLSQNFDEITNDDYIDEAPIIFKGVHWKRAK